MAPKTNENARYPTNDASRSRRFGLNEQGKLKKWARILCNFSQINWSNVHQFFFLSPPSDADNLRDYVNSLLNANETDSTENVEPETRRINALRHRQLIRLLEQYIIARRQGTAA